MRESNEHVEFDITKMEDQALVVLAVDLEMDGVQDVLILRHLQLKDDLIDELARDSGWHAEDVSDAQQEALLWMIEAIHHFDVAQIGRATPCQFRSFLHEVLTRRFIDFARRRQTFEGHIDRRTQLVDDERYESPQASPGLQRVAAADRDGDPVANAQRHEQFEQLRAALKELDETERQIFDLYAAGKTLAEIATEIGSTHDALKHRWPKIKQRLRARLAAR